MTDQRLTYAIRAHLDLATGGRDPSIPGYVERLRQGHAATLLPSGFYGGCTCGKPLCATAVLIVHIDNLTAAFEHSRAEFAAETLRTSCVCRSALIRDMTCSIHGTHPTTAAPAPTEAGDE